MIKLLALDMDGTLLNSQKKISQENISAIHKAIKAGVKLVLCTGRPPFGVRPYYELLGLAQEDEYVIVDNGCAIHRTSDWAVIDSVASKIRSAKVDFPWSIWAMIEKLRIFS